MKSGETLSWLYRKSQKQLLYMLAHIICNMLYAFSGVLFALICKNLIDYAASGDVHMIIKLGIFLLLVSAATILLYMLCLYLKARVQGRLEIDLKTKLLSDIMQKDYISITNFHSGDLLNRLVSDVYVVSDGLSSLLPDLSFSMVKLVSAIIYLCILDKLFVLLLIAGGILFSITVRFLKETLKNRHKDVQGKDGKLRSFIQETLNNTIVVKAFNAESYILSKSSYLQWDHYKAKMKKSKYNIIANSGFSLASFSAYLFALLWCSFALAQKTITFGALTAIIQLVGQFQKSFTSLTGILPSYSGLLASAERLIQIEVLPNEFETSHQSTNIGEIYAGMLSINLQNVSFSYGEKTVLDKVDCVITKGDTVLITGCSGIGKSTLMKLILGVLVPSEGSIYIQADNGQKITVDKHVRRLFAYVPQQNTLFSGTVRENITFANSDATEEDIMAAADMCCVAEFISSCPLGLDTKLGENGQGLSEGQAQRIAIARAVLSGAPILLLDEATSALDEAIEEKLVNNLRTKSGKTCLIISHKKAAAAVCDIEIMIIDSEVETKKRGVCVGNTTN